MPTAKISGVEITCDKLVKQLVNRLIENEKQIVGLQRELEELRELHAEQIPWLVRGAGLRFQGVLESDSENQEAYTIIIPGSAFKVEPKNSSADGRSAVPESPITEVSP